MRVAIIDYGSGNLALCHQGVRARRTRIRHQRRNHADRQSGCRRQRDRIVLPGVGAYADCKAGLAHVPGMIEALREAVESKARPFLGICVGMQLMSSRGLEKSVTQWPGLDQAAMSSK